MNALYFSIIIIIIINNTVGGFIINALHLHKNRNETKA